MTTAEQSDDRQPAEFVDADLRGARFVRSGLSGAVMRGVDVSGMEIDSPDISERMSLVVNGVDVVPYVEAELDRRFPGRELRRATDPAGLRDSWAAVERTWAATLQRVASMPPDVVHVSVAGEWSLAQTLRHLVLATDAWLGGAIMGIEQPFHPFGQPFTEYETDGFDMSIFSAEPPTWEQVLDVRAGHVAMVRDFLADVTPELLVESRPNPWAPHHRQTVLACLHVILNEEWEHHRYAVRDLAYVAADAVNT